MLQFYFLSVLLNVVTGLVLVYATDFNGTVASKENDSESVKSSSEKPDGISLNAFFDEPTFRLVLGILTGFVGIMKLLSTIQNDVPVVGDLLPAIAGIAGSVCVLIEYYQSQKNKELKLPVFIKRIFIEWRKYIGVFCIVVGVLHFIFPKVLFL